MSFLIVPNAINRQGKTFFTGMVATGGTITTDGNYKVHTFTSSGTFTPTTLGSTPTVEYLIVGGGGGGASGFYGGGGGAGGYRTNTSFSVTATGLTVTVGAGGATPGTANTNASAGVASVFSSITSAGGGYGAGGSASSGGGD